MPGAFHDAPGTSDGPVRRSTRALSSREVDRAPSSDAPVTPLRLSSFSLRLPEETPSPVVRGVCERGAEITRPRRSVTISAGTDDPERLPSDGRHSRGEGFPSLRFASARRPGFPVLRASTTTTPFVRLLPRRYDREHDPLERSVPRCAGGPCRRTVRPVAMTRRGPRRLSSPRERRVGFPSLRFSFLDVPCGAPTRARERAVPSTSLPALASGTSPPLLRAASLVGTGREPRVEDSSPGPEGWMRRSPYSTPSRASLGHRLCAWEFGERSRATNQPKTRPTFRAPRRERACERIEMLFIVHHSFARVRIAPRHARMEPAGPSSCYGGRLLTGFSAPL